MPKCDFNKVALQLCNFIKFALRHVCSTVNLLHIFITPFPRNTSGWLAASDLSKVGLTRHINTKHYLETAKPSTKVSKMLRPDVFYEILQKSLKKLTQDECYPEEICSQFTTLE